MFKLQLLFVCIVLFVNVNDTESSRTHDSDQRRRKRSDDSAPLTNVVEGLGQQVADLLAQLNLLQGRVTTVESNTGSVFVRWGRSQCPASATLLYSGYAGGTRGAETGGGANNLCLSPTPVFDDTVALANEEHALLYGAQYYIQGHTNTDVTCSVCYSPLSATFMVPGTNSCPAGSQEQYHGYLSAHSYNSQAASEFVCLDREPEDRVASGTSESSMWFEHTLAVCGSLPCPPYINREVVTCVVCSK